MIKVYGFTLLSTDMCTYTKGLRSRWGLCDSSEYLGSGMISGQGDYFL